MTVIGPVPSKDMQTPPPPLSKSHIYMKYAYSAEMNEKLCIRFLVFELWLIAFTIYGETPSVPPTKNKSYS